MTWLQPNRKITILDKLAVNATVWGGDFFGYLKTTFLSLLKDKWDNAYHLFSVSISACCLLL